MKSISLVQDLSKFTCSLTIDLNNIFGEMTLEKVIQLVISDENKEAITKIRYEKDRDIKSKLKKNLKGFTPSGTFENARKIENLIVYSKLICLDFDSIDAEIFENIKEKIISEKFTIAAFVSPSGNGVKVFVLSNGEKDYHHQTYLEVQNYYETILGIKADPACKDIARLCFLSYDPNAYFNPESEIFQVSKENVIKPSLKAIGEGNTNYNEIDEVVEYTSKKEIYSPGSRNKFVFLLASNCNRRGIDKEIALKYALKKYDLPESEILTSFNSAYKNISEFGKYNDFLNENNPLINTSFLPEDIYEKLPMALDFVKSLTDKRQKDVCLLSILTLFSGAIKGVSGIYDNKKTHPNLFTLVIAPPASGKGSMIIAKNYGQGYHNELLKLNKEDFRTYTADLSFYNKNRNKCNLDAPIKPENKFLFIPANSSQAVFIDYIYSNGGTGVVFETEADVLSGIAKHDWGINSTNLRAGFHNESISMARKSDGLHLEIDSPKFSICLSGTPDQLIKLVESVNNGLFSRFLLYTFQTNMEWRDPSLNNGLESIEKSQRDLEEIGNLVIKKYQNVKVEVKLTPTQWEKHNLFFEKMLHESKIFDGENSASIIFRLGTIAFKLYMTLTAIRNFQNSINDGILFANDYDIDISLRIVEVCAQHSLLISKNLPNKPSFSLSVSGTSTRDLITELPKEFNRKEAIELGTSKYQLSSRTVDGFLSRATNEKYLEKIKTGVYRKL